MNNKDFQKSYEATQAISAEQTFMSKVYGWMSTALIISGLVAYYIAHYQVGLIMSLMTNSLFFWGMILAQLGIVIAISSAINKISVKLAITLFYVYAIMTGITLSTIFLIYTAGSIATTFFITAGTFGSMSLYGYFTKTDLSSIGNMLFMGLIGLIIASVVNIFLASSVLYWITTFIGVLIFVGLTAYDTQKIKKMSQAINTKGESTIAKMAILGALSLYLDFINLFLYLLRLFGNRN